MIAVWEWIWPLARLTRVVRELDAEERIGIAQMQREWHKAQAKEALEQYYRPFLFRRFFCEEHRNEI